jgi:glutamate-1-semialdehyde 2,1-aminomutase
LPALTGFSILSPNALAYKTLITQEMLKKGYLATTAVYVCTQHSKKVVDQYIENLDPIWAKIKECEEGLSVNSLLEGPICHGGFKRLN